MIKYKEIEEYYIWLQSKKWAISRRVNNDLLH